MKEEQLFDLSPAVEANERAGEEQSVRLIDCIDRVAPAVAIECHGISDSPFPRSPASP